MRQWRRYVFPPLATVLGGAARAAPPVTDEAEQLTEEVLNEYRRSGYEEGLAEGRALGAAEASTQAQRAAKAALNELAAPMNELMDGMRGLREELVAQMQARMVTLVEQVSRQVIRAELDARPEQLMAFVEEALAGVAPGDGATEVRLHPDELARITATMPELAARWSLRADNSLEPGECRVSAGGRELDVGCGQRLAVCMEQIRAVIQGAPSP